MGSKRNMKSSHTEPLILPFPFLPTPTHHEKVPKKVSITEFYAVSDGKKKVYTVLDSIQHNGEQAIKNPNEVSLMNLFINGVLQPKENYEVNNGEIILKTIDVPAKDSPVILQMITL